MVFGGLTASGICTPRPGALIPSPITSGRVDRVWARAVAMHGSGHLPQAKEPITVATTLRRTIVALTRAGGRSISGSGPSGSAPRSSLPTTSDGFPKRSYKNEPPCYARQQRHRNVLQQLHRPEAHKCASGDFFLAGSSVI